MHLVPLSVEDLRTIRSGLEERQIRLRYHVAEEATRFSKSTSLGSVSLEELLDLYKQGKELHKRIDNEIQACEAANRLIKLEEAVAAPAELSAGSASVRSLTEAELENMRPAEPAPETMPAEPIPEVDPAYAREDF